MRVSWTLCCQDGLEIRSFGADFLPVSKIKGRDHSSQQAGKKEGGAYGFADFFVSRSIRNGLPCPGYTVLMSKLFSFLTLALKSAKLSM